MHRPFWAPRRPSGGRHGRQEARPEAVLDARTEETRPDAVLGAKRSVQRPSWTPGGSSAGPLGHHEARMQVLLQLCCKLQVLRRRQGGDLGVQSSQRAKPNCVIFV